jgi:hypothetical protein
LSEVKLESNHMGKNGTANKSVSVDQFVVSCLALAQGIEAGSPPSALLNIASK